MHAIGVSCCGRSLRGGMIPRQTFVGQWAHFWVIEMLSLKTTSMRNVSCEPIFRRF